MALTKPTIIPDIDKNNTNRTAPSVGVQDDGFTINDILPSNEYNWVAGFTRDGIAWLYERLFDGATASDVELRGVDSGAGTDLPGGDMLITGGDATGSGSSISRMQAAIAGGAGAAARAKEDFLVANGPNGFLRVKEDVEWLGGTNLVSQEFFIDPSNFVVEDPSAASVFNFGSHIDIPQAAVAAHVAIPLPRYAVLQTVEVFGGSDDAATWGFRVFRKPWNSKSSTQVGGTATSDGTANDQTVSLTSLAHTVLNATNYEIIIDIPVSGALEVIGARIVVDLIRPNIYGGAS